MRHSKYLVAATAAQYQLRSFECLLCVQTMSHHTKVSVVSSPITREIASATHSRASTDSSRRATSFAHDAEAEARSVRWRRNRRSYSRTSPSHDDSASWSRPVPRPRRCTPPHRLISSPSWSVCVWWPGVGVWEDAELARKSCLSHPRESSQQQEQPTAKTKHMQYITSHMAKTSVSVMNGAPLINIESELARACVL